MKYINRLKAHPLRLLLYLEWILFIITLMGRFDASKLPSPRMKPPMLLLFPQLNGNSPTLFMLCTVAFIILGLWQPSGKYGTNIRYTVLGFVLIALTGITSGTTIHVLPSFLLIMVIRGCLSFKLPGSLVVAGISFFWFFLSLFISVQHNLNSLNMQQVPAIITPGSQPKVIYQLYSNDDQFKAFIINIAINSAIFFCLISLFVFLLVNALLSEYRSRKELALVNEQLREYALLIEDRAMLQERNRIAREIHDSLGHSLTAQNIQLANALLYLRSNLDRTETFLTEAKKLGSHALQDVRHSVATLRSDPLQGKSLSLAIADLVEDLQYRTEITFHYHSEIPHTLSQEITTTVYRIVQEALTNMIKHSQATEVNISTQLVANYLEVQVKDNGTGFDPKENTTGFGIQGMRERTTALGGIFNLVSMPDMGCQITATIPLFGKY
ncbi:MAG: sensor histidine kinase [Xenococcaceae cyanobacterium MO_167.B27]|nr:sensor histidine kinase [Xenococcaceae cyanobacterium MO_167.B27]